MRDTGVEEEKLSKMMTVFNKIDVKDIEGSNFEGRNFVSALTGKGINELKNSLTKIFNEFQ